MTTARIAVLFDAENINGQTAQHVLGRLAAQGVVPIRRAVADFSIGALASWIECARGAGIELVMQPSLGKGKNGADIRLAIEAMDIVHQRQVDTIALVTHDRDFTPLALRLRNSGVTVMGFSQTEPPAAFRVACSTFSVIGPVSPRQDTKPIPVTVPVPGPSLQKAELARLRAIAVLASKDGPIFPVDLTKAVIAADPGLATRLSGQGKFLKTLISHGVVERVGSGATLKVQAR